MSASLYKKIKIFKTVFVSYITTVKLFYIAIRNSCCIAKSNFISDSIFLPNVGRYNIDNICYSYKDHKSYQYYKSYLNIF